MEERIFRSAIVAPTCQERGHGPAAYYAAGRLPGGRKWGARRRSWKQGIIPAVPKYIIEVRFAYFAMLRDGYWYVLFRSVCYDSFSR